MPTTTFCVCVGFHQDQGTQQPRTSATLGVSAILLLLRIWDHDGKLEPDTWMNDVAEKIPNWFESGRLYYAYTGDSSVMSIVKQLMDYTLAMGRALAPSPGRIFPIPPRTLAMSISRFTSAKRFALNETLVGYAGIWAGVLRHVSLQRGRKIPDCCLDVANMLARSVRTGTATHRCGLTV